MTDTYDDHFVLALIGRLDDDIGETRHDPFQGPGDCAGVTHQREPCQALDTLENSVNDARGATGRSLAIQADIRSRSANAASRMIAFMHWNVRSERGLGRA